MTIPAVSGSNQNTWVWSTDTNTTHIIGFNRSQHLMTHDGGITWDSVHYDNGVLYDMFDIQFLDKNIGFVVGNAQIGLGVMFKTINGGQIWTKIQTFPVPIFAARWLDVNYGFAAGSSGKYYYTRDGGLIWNSVDVKDQFNNVWALSRMQITSDGAINIAGTSITAQDFTRFDNKNDATPNLSQITYDAGFSSDAALLDMFASPNRLYALLTNKNLAYKPNNSNAWVDISSNFPISNLDTIIPGEGLFSWPSLSLWFVNDSTGWIVGGEDLILKTIDAGNSWEIFWTGKPRTTTNSPKVNRSIMVYESDTVRVGWAVGQEGNAWKMREIIPRKATIVNRVSLADDIKIYPNPASDVIFFITPNQVTYNVTITSITGSAMKQHEISPLLKVIEIKDLPTGNYFINVYSKDGKSTSKKLTKL